MPTRAARGGVSGGRAARASAGATSSHPHPAHPARSHAAKSSRAGGVQIIAFIALEPPSMRPRGQ
jgi:hypothetical protein